MKKLILIFTLLFIFTFSGQSFAASTGSLNSTIDHIEYDSNHNYIAVTKDTGNGEWCLNLFESDKYNQSVCDELAHMLDHKQVTITYDMQNSNNSDDWYVTDWKIDN